MAGNAPSATTKSRMSSTKRYWMDQGDLTQDSEMIKGRENEFPQDLAIDQVLSDPNFSGASTGRRDFLKFLGFGIGAVSYTHLTLPTSDLV